MKNDQLIQVLFLLIFMSACGPSDERTVETEQRADSALLLPAPPAAEIPGDSNQITGLLQYSGLQAAEAQALGLKQGRYQLISQEAYFLEGSDSLEAYVGQCVLLSGRPKSWDKAQVEGGQQTTYSRSLFVVEDVQPLMYSRCHFSDTLAAQPQGREVVYTGRVERMQRPAPDIAYDYQLRLQDPYKDPDHPVTPGKLVETLPLITGSFEALSKLEGSVRQNSLLQIKGIQQQGYAEQEAVFVVSADSLNL